jgi:hypothetical protein
VRDHARLAKLGGARLTRELSENLVPDPRMPRAGSGF